MFDSFYRIDRSRNSRVPDSGLGLAIAREIVLLHKGEIGVKTNGGKGSRFYFSLPLVQE
ncbi:ATP-binding protein [Paenibacillus sp. HW567]|uniref:ATP-binding protein n=1 Tax=Paenibacillus sp. HW567 TaxID=1034769 RepID=UPI0003735492|nr:ATP-binding protein [Paenibacillus sp. HW567]